MAGILPAGSLGRRWCLIGLALFAAVAVGEDALAGPVRGRISFPQKFQQDLPSGSGLTAAKVIVDGGQYAALPTADGYFVISDVPVGPHLLQVVHPRLMFDLVRVDVQEAKGGTVKMTAHLADLEHGKGQKLKYPLGLAPSEVFHYLEKREEFNILSVFKSPMALISLFSCGAMLLLPKLQPMIDEEKERQRVEAEAREGRDAVTNDRR
mmetsp:Transcript_72924/g.165384  ORF Transcript_72924/g.165384 Transcript_72924/m.165384 type:complete len:209 (+) Transcript_72924:66-692(+)